MTIKSPAQLATYDPIYISSKWRARLLEKVLKHTEEDNDLVSMKAHFETILEEGTDGRFELLAHFFSALPHQQKSALSSLWSKALEYIPEDRAPSDDIYELLLLGTCTQPHLSTKMFQLIGHCDDTNKKVELYRKLLPVWTEINGRQMIYRTLVQLLSEPKQIQLYAKTGSKIFQRRQKLMKT